jgi:hypothetical protein
MNPYDLGDLSVTKQNKLPCFIDMEKMIP